MVKEVGDAVFIAIGRQEFNDNGDNSWAIKELELFIPDGNSGYKTMGYVNLNYNTWVETWNNNMQVASEDISFNDANFEWLGNSRLSE